MKVILRKLSEDVPDSFICETLLKALNISVSNCEEKLRLQGNIEFQVSPDRLSQIESILKRYSFLSYEVVREDKELIPVKVALGKGTTPSLACSILSGILGYRVEGCDQEFKEKGEIYLELEPEKARKLIDASKNYPFLKVTPFKELYSTKVGFSVEKEGGISESLSLIKHNPGFFFAFSFVYVVILLLSFLPLIGLVFSFINSLFLYAVLLYITAHSLSKQKEGLSLSKVQNYFMPSLGINIGAWVFLILVGLLSILLLIPFGILGALSDAIQENYFNEGVVASSIVWLLLLVLFIGYYIYAIPLIYSKAFRDGLTFEAGFKAVFYPFIPAGLKEAFSNTYFKHSFLWMAFITVVAILTVVSAITVILIPVALFLICWMITYTAIVIRDYTVLHYKPAL